ncbi:hypothetical protein EAG_04749 [Camponotus floridanus]|uniref:Uncharacterized protein n=1 Tax=Camponotus floridanus TaxID=104421 RepID=E2A742_CAMFO|nr:hypothetical protein EAG_04749 [Camponotus floridanus]
MPAQSISQKSNHPKASTNGDIGRQLKTQGNPRLAPDNPIFFNMPTIFLPDGQRTFSNPLSYLGGPILPLRNRSIESVLSLD